MVGFAHFIHLCSYLTVILHVQAVRVQVRWMCSPLPLRLCCMAAMAPALTEAATQTRGKLPSSPAEPRDPTLVNGRDCVTTPTPDVKDRIVGRTSPLTNGIANSQPNLASLITRKDLVSSRLASLTGTVKSAGLVNLGTVPNLSEIYKQQNQKLSATSSAHVYQRGQVVKNHNTVNSTPQHSDRHREMNSSQRVNMPNKSAVLSFHPSTPNHIPAVTSSKKVSTPSLDPPAQITTSSCVNTDQKTDAMTSGSGVNLKTPRVTSNKPTVSIDAAPVVIKTETVTVPEFTSASIDSASRKHRDLVRRAERLERRIRRLQARKSSTHVQQQLSGFVDSQHETLQSLARSMRVPTNTADLKAELLHSEDVKNLSTAALVNLVRKVQSSQAITLRQRLTSATPQQPEPNSILKLNADLSAELGSVSTQLSSNLHHVERAVDSDATESSSGGESADEGDYAADWGGRYTHQLPM